MFEISYSNKDLVETSEFSFDVNQKTQKTKCRYGVYGCPFTLASMELHENQECEFRPTRCPSLTCSAKPPFVKLLKHLEVSDFY